MARHDDVPGPRPGNALEAVTAELIRELGTRAALTGPAALRAYDCDGLTTHRATPGLVVLAADAEAVSTAVAACARHGVPFVARGSGTGLSGGATPQSDGVLIVTSRMRQILAIDPQNRRAVVQPGVVNASVTAAAAPHGLYFAPDPSSQQICSIGGNVAENSGGAHCLKYGFTTHHVTGLEVVLPDGERVRLGGSAVEYPGYDLVGAFVGSEGTLGVVTEVTLRLLPVPEAVRCLLSAFTTTDAAGEAVSAIIGAGVVPAAIEMMDALAISAVEAGAGVAYPAGAGAVLIVELDGPHAEVEHLFGQVTALCQGAGAFAVQVAADDAERAAIWRGRKAAFAAVGRISADYYVQDGVVPRTALPATLQRISELAVAAGLRVANVFHAGDGNLHPLVLYDASVPGETEAAAALAEAIVALCVEQGGSITGEHGVGLDKRDSMPKMFTADDLSTMLRLRTALDPAGLCNPGKVFPAPRLCGEAPGPRSGVHPRVASGEAELF